MKDPADLHTVTLEPNWEATCEWFGRALAEHAFEQFAREPVICFIEQVRYLSLTDPAAITRVIDRLAGK